MHAEVVVAGLARGYPDAAAIEEAIKPLVDEHPEHHAEPAGMVTVDHTVLRAGRSHGALLTNDLALGRRAANLGVHWLRTADLVALCVRTGRVSTGRGQAALLALHSSGRITAALLRAT